MPIAMATSRPMTRLKVLKKWVSCLLTMSSAWGYQKRRYANRRGSISVRLADPKFRALDPAIRQAVGRAQERWVVARARGRRAAESRAPRRSAWPQRQGRRETGAAGRRARREVG